jgi:murein DD-endopeptidase MepM/ murein hydrolase activator NlpD
VDGKVVTPFGRIEHPKYHTVTMSKGIDIESQMGTPVRSVGDGVVDLVQWIPGYGETIILNHGLGYYSIYGHLSAVSVARDDRVEPGQVIGAVGDTGSLKGANLHFEIRQKGEALDPMGWLR